MVEIGINGTETYAFEANNLDTSAVHPTQSGNVESQLLRKKKMHNEDILATFASEHPLPKVSSGVQIKHVLLATHEAVYPPPKGFERAEFEFETLEDGPGISLQDLDEVQSHSPFVDNVDRENTTFVAGPLNIKVTYFEVFGSPPTFSFEIPPFLFDLRGEDVLSLTDNFCPLFSKYLDKHARSNPFTEVASCIARVIPDLLLYIFTYALLNPISEPCC